MTRVFVVLLMLLLGSCGGTWDKLMGPDVPDSTTSADRAPTRTAAVQSGCYRGRLTEEGSTCQTMRTDRGVLISLGGPLRGFGAGDVVCVCGVPAREQFCKLGLTLLIREISSTCADIQ